MSKQVALTCSVVERLAQYGLWVWTQWQSSGREDSFIYLEFEQYFGSVGLGTIPNFQGCSHARIKASLQ